MTPKLSVKEKEEKQRFIQLRAEGVSYHAIEQTLNVPTDTLFEWGQEMQTQVEINNRAQLERERIQEQYNLNGTAPFSTFADIRKRILDSMTGDDFKKIPLDRRIDMLIKVDRVCKEYAPKPGDGLTLEEVQKGLFLEMPDLGAPCKVQTKAL